MVWWHNWWPAWCSSKVTKDWGCGMWPWNVQMALGACFEQFLWWLGVHACFGREDEVQVNWEALHFKQYWPLIYSFQTGQHSANWICGLPGLQKQVWRTVSHFRIVSTQTIQTFLKVWQVFDSNHNIPEAYNRCDNADRLWWTYTVILNAVTGNPETSPASLWISQAATIWWCAHSDSHAFQQHE